MIIYGVGKGSLEYKPAKAGDIQRFVGDSTLAYDVLGWQCHIPLRYEGLRMTIDWVKDNLELYKEYNL